MASRMVRIILGIVVALASLLQLGKIPSRSFGSDAEKAGYVVGTLAIAALAIWLIWSGVSKRNENEPRR
jgi:hypothetical protein